MAAIASELAGRLYDVPVLRPRIEDNRQNTTRFLVLGRQPAGPSGSRDKTSIVFAMPNQPGALYRILEPLARDGSQPDQDRVAAGASARRRGTS